MKKLLTILVIGIFTFSVFGFSLYLGTTLRTEAAATLAGEAIDVIGTKSGTTTTGVSFSDFTLGTTTYPTLVTANTDLATYTFKAKEASTSGAKVYLSFLGSNDTGCDSATTTTIFNVVTTGQVNWFDIGSHLRGLANTLSLVGTSTASWSPTVGQGIEVTLVDLNYKCTAVQVQATSTVLWSQVNLKGKI